MKRSSHEPCKRRQDGSVFHYRGHIREFCIRESFSYEHHSIRIFSISIILLRFDENFTESDGSDLKKNADQRTKNSGSDIANSDFTFKYFPCSVLFNTRRRDPLRLTTLLFFNYDRQFNYSFVEESRLRRATFRNRYRYIHIYPEISPPDTS